MTVPTLAGIHHLKLPVRDLQRSADWYGRVLGYRVVVEFVEQGRLAGLGLEHPDGGPPLALRLDPARAAAAAGFDYFSVGVPDRAGIEALAAHLDVLGLAHAGVHRASEGWILPMLLDPDGHEVRFYTHARHEDAPTGPHRVHDPGPDMRIEPLP
jgi:catechol 2,3-dioxygenase-like lactoylglutathione lyase family enzyme